MGIVQRIKDLASVKHLTLAELERIVGISNGQIRKWDDSKPGIDKIQKVADYFDVSIDYLLGRSSNPEDSNKNSPLKVDLNDDTIIMTFNDTPLTDRDREVVLAATRALIEQREKEKKK